MLSATIIHFPDIQGQVVVAALVLANATMPVTLATNKLAGVLDVVLIKPHGNQSQDVSHSRSYVS